jgi:hypothetical protein
MTNQIGEKYYATSQADKKTATKAACTKNKEGSKEV